MSSHLVGRFSFDYIKKASVNKHNELYAMRFLTHFYRWVFGFQCPHPEPLPSINHPDLVNLTPLITRPNNPHNPTLRPKLLPPPFFYPCPSPLATSQWFSHQTWGNKPLPEPNRSNITDIIGFVGKFCKTKSSCFEYLTFFLLNVIVLKSIY